MGPPSAPYMNKMISIKPFSVEYERATSFLGNVLGIEKYSGPVYEGNLTFTTQCDVGSSAGGCAFAFLMPISPCADARNG